MPSIYDLESLLSQDVITPKTSKERILKDPYNHNCVCFDKYLMKTMIKNVEEVSCYINWRPRNTNCADFIEKDCLYVPFEVIDLDNIISIKEAISDTAEIRIPTLSMFDVSLIFIPRVGLHYEDISVGVEEFKDNLIILIKRKLSKMKSNALSDFDKKQVELNRNLNQTRELLSSLKEVVTHKADGK
jgi:hypothetical protein